MSSLCRKEFWWGAPLIKHEALEVYREMVVSPVLLLTWTKYEGFAAMALRPCAALFSISLGCHFVLIFLVGWSRREVYS